MKKFRFLLYAVFIIFYVQCIVVFCQPKTLTILHTNDMHARFLPHEAAWMKETPKPMVGGFLELGWKVDSIRHSKNLTLLLDGGDVMTGTPISDMDYNGVTGGALFQMMNLIGYDAWTPGNHDLDISQENLRQRIQMSKFATVVANIVDSTGKHKFGNPFIILNKDGLRVGIIGLMTKGLFRETNTKNLVGLKVLSSVEVTQKIIDSIRSKTDVLIALTHEGVEDDSVLAASTHGLNVIIGGHSHTRLTKPKYINGVVICQAGSQSENLGVLDLTVENQNVTSYDGKLIQLWPRKEYPNNDLTKLVNEFKSKIENEYDEVVGTLVTDWKRGGGETNIGNFASDALREAVHADIAVTNSTGLRTDLGAGPIKKQSIFEVMPFKNMVCTFTLSGKDLRVLAEHYANGFADGRVSIQTSGLKCTWKRVEGKAVIQELTVNGKALDDNTTYTCATSDFVVNQAEKYLWMTPSNPTCTSISFFDALLSKVKRDKTINSQIENRFEEAK